jgi:2-amino-4-hydroxy-6-hydroxymethyldihydropteridine diphosphokinase
MRAARVTRPLPAPDAGVPGDVAFVGIGANLGDARCTVAEALTALARLPGCSLRGASPVYLSAPVDAAGPDFFNAVAEVHTTLSPLDLLQALQAIEAAFGRERPYRNAPRTLDLDLLLHGDAVLNTLALTLPHPRLQLRAFVLRPLLDLAPALAAPGLGPLAAWLPGVADQPIKRLVTP